VNRLFSPLVGTLSVRANEPKFVPTNLLCVQSPILVPPCSISKACMGNGQYAWEKVVELHKYPNTIYWSNFYTGHFPNKITVLFKKNNQFLRPIVPPNTSQPYNLVKTNPTEV
jgi:hypothetical protein